MAKVSVDFTLPLPDLEGRPLTLTQATKGKKAVALHFFSPWSQECAESMPDLAAVTNELEEHGIGVINIIGETAPEAIADTRELLLSAKTPPPGLWLADHDKKPLARLLRVQSAPSIALLAPNGKVLFNGHPADDDFWKALEAIDPACKRPALQSPGG